MSFPWLTYDSASDALYIHLTRPHSFVQTNQIDDSVAIDLDDNENVVGIEILSPSEELLEALGL
jgi:uncharacterized protein YuzE